jgi:hypothetical protein
MSESLHFYPINALKDRLVLFKDKDVLLSLACPECKKIVSKPYECQICHNTFCLDCLNKYMLEKKTQPISNPLPSQKAQTFLPAAPSSCPRGCAGAKFGWAKNKVNGQLSKLMVRCRNYESGCHRSVSLQEVCKHESKWAYSLIRWQMWWEFIVFNTMKNHMERCKLRLKSKFVWKEWKGVFDISSFEAHEKEWEMKKIQWAGHPKWRYLGERKDWLIHENSWRFLKHNCHKWHQLLDESQSHDCFATMKKKLEEKELDLQEFNIKLENKENEVENYKSEIWKLQQLVMKKKTVLQDLKKGYEYGLDYYQTKENERVCSEIDNILLMVESVQNLDPENPQQLKKREFKDSMKNWEMVEIPFSKDESAGDLTAKILTKKTEIQTPNFYKLQAAYESMDDKDDQLTVEESTFDATMKSANEK